MKYIIFIASICVLYVGYLIYTPAPQSANGLSRTSQTVTHPYPPLPEMVGQLFMIGHWAHEPLASTTARIAENHIGSVIIMSAPDNPAEIPSWVATWNAVADSPLLIAIDQEGGSVSRLKNDRYATTSQREITNPETALIIGQARGEDLHKRSINLNFAPVLDVATHPDSFLYNRSFPANTDHATLAGALLKGMARSNVFGVVKHFPGHANTPDDSHATLPEVPITKSELDAFTTDFRTLIATHPPAAIMTAHVSYPLIDRNPATLSPFLLTDYLRGDLGFTGVLITDDLIMEAITSVIPSDEAAVAAIQAGADICLFAAKPAEVEAAITAVLHAVADGRISDTRIKESYDRVQALKQRL